MLIEHVAVEPPSVDAASVYAESERMKHELEILQQKISSLNMAQQYHQRMQMHQQHQQQQQQAPISYGHHADKAYVSSQPMHLDLASELTLIEKTIRDREMEIQINSCMKKESPKGLDYGTYISQGTYIITLF